MEVTDFPTIDPNTDFEKILPIHQKRIIAFINHFITNTVSFLNTFAQSCESRLMEFEYKMQKVEASLLILESQLSSISSLDNADNSNDDSASHNVTEQKTVGISLDLPEITSPEQEKRSNDAEVNSKSQSSGPKANEDSRFVRFFKMIQFGVPADAVKHKMTVEGFDPSILDKPDTIVPGYIIEAKHESSSNSSNNSS